MAFTVGDRTQQKLQLRLFTLPIRTLNPSWITNNGSGELSFADFVRRALIFFWTTYFLVNKFSNLPPLARMHI